MPRIKYRLSIFFQEVRLRTIAHDSRGLGSNWAQMIPLARPKVQPVPGHLYVLSVGLSRYENADGKRLKNLLFAAADAHDMAARLHKEGKPLYDDL